mgnify:CR=1 FL=1
MTEHIDWEGFLRFEIYTEYICTDHFQSFLSGALEALDNINTQIHSERTIGQGQANRKLIAKFRPEVNHIVHILAEKTGVPSKCEFINEDFCFILKKPTYYFDTLPLVDKRMTPIPPDMISLMFDVTRGLDKQLKSAKTKLKSHRLEVQKKQGKSASDLAFKRLATTRQSFEHILDAITFVALCDKEKRENKRSRKSIAEEMDMPYSSAKSKYQTGTKIINSGQIRKYFPEFRFE